MAGPLMAVGRALLGSELTQPVVNRLVSSGALDPNVARLLYGQSLGSTLAQAAEPMGRLMGLLPEEPPNYNLPTDYYVGPQGQVLSSEGERMITGEGITGFQPENQFGLPVGGFNHYLDELPTGPGGGFMPGGTGSTPYESIEEELERLAARYAGQPSSADGEEEDESGGGAAWWPRAPQVDPRFLQQQQAQQR